MKEVTEEVLVDFTLEVIPKLGEASFRLLSAWQPDDMCRTCGKSTKYEVTTERPLKKGGIAIPCCLNKLCYNGSVGQRTVINQIKSMAQA